MTPSASVILGTVIGPGLFEDGTNGGFVFFGCSTGLLIGVAGDDVAELPFGPVEDFDVCLLRESSIDPWSTGKKLQSFFKRMQLIQRPWVSLGDVMHLIFRRRQ